MTDDTEPTEVPLPAEQGLEDRGAESGWSGRATAGSRRQAAVGAPEHRSDRAPPAPAPLRRWTA